MATESPDNWKQKYFSNLDKLEKKEAALAEVEALLKNAVARLCLAAEGHDSQIDRPLKKLRKLVRGNYELSEVQTLLDAVAEAVRNIDQRTADESSRQEAVKWLVRVAQELGKLPRLAPACATFEAALESGEVVAECLSTFRKSISEAVTQAAPSPTAPGETTKAHVRWTTFVNRLGLSEAGQTSLQGWCVDFAKTSDESEIDGLLTKLAGALNRELSVVRSGDKVSDIANTQYEAPSSNFILLQLLEHIPVPAELVERANAIREKLLELVPSNEWATLLSEIAGLIGDMRRQLEAERSDLENFLVQLTGRLQELDTQLKGTQGQGEEAYRSGQVLNQAVACEMQGIESSLLETASIDTLKGAIQARLDAIRLRMEEFVVNEERRHRELEDRLAESSRRLKRMEEEGEGLRSNLRKRREQAMKDALTGLFNRLAFNERAEHECARWKRHRAPLALMVLDIDHFKKINDTFGHQAGDKALQLIAKVLGENIRETDFLARYGGEEFVLLLPDTPFEALAGVAEKLRAAVAKTEFHYRGKPVTVTVSGGFTAFEEGDTVETVFERADSALYRAKQEGRNRVLAERSNVVAHPAKNARRP
jgi:diguanylate cyclase